MSEAMKAKRVRKSKAVVAAAEPPVVDVSEPAVVEEPVVVEKEPVVVEKEVAISKRKRAPRKKPVEPVVLSSDDSVDEEVVKPVKEKSTKSNKWIECVKQYRAEHPEVSYKDCLKQAKVGYKP
jgi:hypothetical protein